MKNLAPIFVIALFAFVNYIERAFPALPSAINYLPDLGVALLSAAIVARLIGTRAWAVIPLTYVLLLVGFVYVLVCGFVLNGVTGDTIFAGVRSYLKYLPLFLLPLAFDYSDDDLRFQSKAMLALLLLQVPVTVWQRFFEFAGLGTGDVVRGTFGTSSVLAMIGVGAVVAVCALYFDKRLSASRTILLALAFSLPASLAETKATPFLLLAGLFGVLVVRRESIGRRQLAQLAVTVALILGSFVALYDWLYGERFEESVAAQVTDPDYFLGGYQLKGMRAESLRLDRKVPHGIVGVEEGFELDDDRKVGRFDSFLIPFSALYEHEKVRLLVGLGAGNVDTTFGSGGDYQAIKRELGGAITTYSMMLWETGVLGTAFYLAFILLVLRDSYRAARTPGPGSTLGAVCVGVTFVYLVSMAYKNTYHLSEVQAIYIYVAGLTIAAHLRRRHRVTNAGRAPLPRMVSGQPGHATPLSTDLGR